MKVGLLGDLVIVTDDGPLVGLPAKERATVTALALRPGRSVSTTELVSIIWGEDPPPSARKALQTYISRLRHILPTEIITTTGGGYALGVGVEDVDAGRFETLVRRATQSREGGDLPAAAADLTEALGLWRGTALMDVAEQPIGMAEAARLEELRREAEEDLIEVRLGLGAHTRVVAEADAAVAAEPLRERRWAQLMLALYRSGRQADALRAYRRLRERLIDELGIEPSAELEALESSILQKKPELAWAPTNPESPQPGWAEVATPMLGDKSSHHDAPQLPSGVVTFVLTDIVGSTAMWDAEPRRMAELLERHDSLIFKAVHANGGVLLKSKGEGDSTLSVFTRASAGVTAAIALLQEVEGTVWSTGLDVRLRVAVHTGEAHERAGDYFGPTLNRAARLRSVAVGGQVLCTAVTAALVWDELPDGVRLVERGPHKLPGLSRAEVIYELTTPLAQPETLSGLARPQPGVRVQSEPALLHPLILGGQARPPFPVGLDLSPWFSGRGVEIDLLDRCFARARQGGVESVVLAGEPGIGKSALAAAAAASLYEAGAAVLFGSAEEGVAVPYKPWLDALAPLLTRDLLLDEPRLLPPQRRVLARAFPELAEPDYADARANEHILDPQLEQHLFMRAIVELLALASEHWPLLVILNDLHWADSGTIQLLRRLAVNDKRQRLLLLLTYRHTEANDGHSLRSLVISLRPHITEIELGGLAVGEVGDLLTAAAGHEIGDEGARLAEVLRRDTGGNPLFLVQLVRHLAERGELQTDADGRWAIDVGASSLSLPRHLVDVVTERLIRLDPTLQNALSVASVLGDPFDVDILANILGVEVDGLVSLLDHGEQSALLVSTSPNCYRFAHAVIRDAVYQKLSRPRLSRVHIRAASALEARQGPVRHDEIARHLELSGIPEAGKDAIRHYEEAGVAAIRALSPRDATVHYEAALRLLEATAGPPKRICEVKIRLGETLRLSGDPRHREILLDALDTAVQLDAADLVVDAALAAWRGWASRDTTVDTLWVEVLQRALDAIGSDDSRTRSHLLALLAIEDSYGGRPDDAERRSHESVEIARGLNDDRLLLDALEARYQAIHVPQHLDERVAIVEERRRLTRRTGEERSAWVTAQHAFQAALESCRIDGADRCLAEETRLAAKLSDPYASWITSMHRYSRAILAGHIREAEMLAQATHLLGQEAGRPDADAVYAGQLFFVLLYLGRVGELVGLLEAAADDFPHIQAFQSGLVTAYCEVGEFEKAVVRLDEQRRRYFSESRPDITWLGALTQFAHAAATVGHRSAAERLLELLTPFEGQLAYSGAVVFDVVATSLARLAHMLGAEKESRLWFHQAQELSRNLDAPLLRALVQIHEAELLLTDSKSAAATWLTHLVPKWRYLASQYDCALVGRRAEKLLDRMT